ncbi:hypothetical protein M3Y95_00300400 [Aphelenchoides besseyi]|nr:hypothetical protein M3Y95_00300400 [Aphelenchoides besseyi]
MSARYNHALKDEVVNYVSYLLKSNSQKSEMAEEQLRKKYEAEYGRPLREDLQVLHMSMAEVLALARAKDGYQKSNVSELEVENSPIAQKKAVSVVSKAREQQPKAPLQEKMVEKKKSRKRLVETPSLLSDDGKKNSFDVSSDSEEFLSNSSSERNTPMSNNSTDPENYRNKESPRPTINQLPPICRTPSPPLNTTTAPSPQVTAQSTPQVTAKSTVSEQMNSRLSLTSPASYKSVMTADNFMSMSSQPSGVSAARQMHNVVQKIILEVEQSIRNGRMKIQECLHASDKQVTQSLTSDEFYRHYVNCIPERQRLTCVQLQRLLVGLVDAANCVEDAFNDEL